MMGRRCPGMVSSTTIMTVDLIPIVWSMWMATGFAHRANYSSMSMPMANSSRANRSPTRTLNALGTRVVQTLESAYFEGLVNLRLFGVPFEKVQVDASVEGIEFHGTYPFLAADASFTAGWRNLYFNQALLDLAKSPFV